MSNTPPPPYTAEPPKVPMDTQQGYPQPPQFSAIGQQPPIIHNTPIVVRAVNVNARTAPFGPFPVQMDCPYCNNHIVTHTANTPGALPWIVMAVCFVLGFFLLVPWCLCCLPFCIDSCLDVLHTCPSCKRLIGRFSRL